MKLLLIVLGFFIMPPEGVFAQMTDADLIAKALHKSADDWNRGDIEAYMNAYHKSDSLLFGIKRADFWLAANISEL